MTYPSKGIITSTYTGSGPVVIGECGHVMVDMGEYAVCDTCCSRSRHYRKPIYHPGDGFDCLDCDGAYFVHGYVSRVCFKSRPEINWDSLFLVADREDMWKTVFFEKTSHIRFDFPRGDNFAFIWRLSDNKLDTSPSCFYIDNTFIDHLR